MKNKSSLSAAMTHTLQQQQTTTEDPNSQAAIDRALIIFYQ
jgi:hypothetical protein